MTPMLNESSGSAVLRLLPSMREHEGNNLPILTTAADIRELIQYLSRKPSGLIPAEELDRPKKRLFEDRKLEAYQLLGITVLEDQTLRLSPLGWRIARSMEADAQVFRYLLQRNLPYSTALSWMAEQNSDMITSVELREFWHGTHAEAFSFDDQEAIRGSIISFFSICQAAALGTLTLGKRGHITRFFVDRAEVAKFSADSSVSDLLIDQATDFVAHDLLLEPTATSTAASSKAPFTVLIKCRNQRIQELIESTVGIIRGVRSSPVDIIWNSNVAEMEPIENRAREACCLITVLDDDCFNEDSAGNSILKDKALMELGAAQVLYHRRLIILADSTRLTRDSMTDLICCELEGERLGWETGLKLVKLIEEFRAQSERSV